jgi:hypothetical protein
MAQFRIEFNESSDNAVKSLTAFVAKNSSLYYRPKDESDLYPTVYSSTPTVTNIEGTNKYEVQLEDIPSNYIAYVNGELKNEDESKTFSIEDKVYKVDENGKFTITADDAEYINNNLTIYTQAPIQNFVGNLRLDHFTDDLKYDIMAPACDLPKTVVPSYQEHEGSARIIVFDTLKSASGSDGLTADLANESLNYLQVEFKYEQSWCEGNVISIYLYTSENDDTYMTGEMSVQNTTPVDLNELDLYLSSDADRQDTVGTVSDYIVFRNLSTPDDQYIDFAAALPNLDDSVTATLEQSETIPAATGFTILPDENKSFLDITAAFKTSQQTTSLKIFTKDINKSVWDGTDVVTKDLANPSTYSLLNLNYKITDVSSQLNDLTPYSLLCKAAVDDSSKNFCSIKLQGNGPEIEPLQIDYQLKSTYFTVIDSESARHPVYYKIGVLSLNEQTNLTSTLVQEIKNSSMLSVNNSSVLQMVKLLDTSNQNIPSYHYVLNSDTESSAIDVKSSIDSNNTLKIPCNALLPLIKVNESENPNTYTLVGVLYMQLFNKGTESDTEVTEDINVSSTDISETASYVTGTQCFDIIGKDDENKWSREYNG